MRYERISADCHIDLCQLPPDLFTSNASAALKDRMPYVTDSPKGKMWVSKNGGFFGLAGGTLDVAQNAPADAQHHRSVTAEQCGKRFFVPAPSKALQQLAVRLTCRYFTADLTEIAEDGGELSSRHRVALPGLGLPPARILPARGLPLSLFSDAPAKR